MMKLKPRTELKLAGIGLAVMALLLTLAVIVFLRQFIRFQHIAWQTMFRSEHTYNACKEIWQSQILGLAGIALIFGVGAWVIFRHVDKIPD
ncbi:MAG: hypothetical protein ABIT76_05965 [Chthoniobacterales bacterium]